MSVWDCFFFNDEIDLLRARLRELEAVVDRFVVVEGVRSYAGAPKPLHFAENRHLFDAWSGRILHVVADLPEVAPVAFRREEAQRRVLREALRREVPGDALVLVGDVDELPSCEAVAYLRDELTEPTRLLLNHAIYFANWWLPKADDIGTMACRGDQLEAPMMRAVLGDPHDQWEGYRERQLLDAGTHLSYVGGISKILSKWTSYSHQEFNTSRFRTEAHLRRCIEYGIHFEGRHTLRRLRLDELNPCLTRLSAHSPQFFDFSAGPQPLEVQAFCGYAWLRAQPATPERAVRWFDRHPNAVSAARPVFLGVQGALRLRRRLIRLRPDWRRPVRVPFPK